MLRTYRVTIASTELDGPVLIEIQAPNMCDAVHPDTLRENGYGLGCEAIRAEIVLSDSDEEVQF